jgi:hypothetical protein
MSGELDLEGGMPYVEVAAQALLKRVEHGRAQAVGEHLGLHHDVHGQHRQPGRDRPGMQVVHVPHPGQTGQVPPDLAEINAARACLKQDVDGIGEQPPGPWQDQGAN